MKHPFGPAARGKPACAGHATAFSMPGHARERLLECLFQRSAEALRLAPAQALRLRPCFEDCRLVKLGLDSLGALELSYTLHEDLGLHLSLEELLGPATVHQLATRMLQTLAARDLMGAALVAQETEAWTL